MAEFAADGDDADPIGVYEQNDDTDEWFVNTDGYDEGGGTPKQKGGGAPKEKGGGAPKEKEDAEEENPRSRDTAPATAASVASRAHKAKLTKEADSDVKLDDALATAQALIDAGVITQDAIQKLHAAIGGAQSDKSKAAEYAALLRTLVQQMMDAGKLDQESAKAAAKYAEKQARVDAQQNRAAQREAAAMKVKTESAIEQDAKAKVAAKRKELEAMPADERAKKKAATKAFFKGGGDTSVWFKMFFRRFDDDEDDGGTAVMSADEEELLDMLVVLEVLLEEELPAAEPEPQPEPQQEATSSDDEFQPGAAESDEDAQIAALQQQVRTLKLEQQAQEFGVGDEVEIAEKQRRQGGDGRQGG